MSSSGWDGGDAMGFEVSELGGTAIRGNAGEGGALAALAALTELRRAGIANHCTRKS